MACIISLQDRVNFLSSESISLTLRVPRDPTFVFRAFYYFRLRFFDRYFF